MIASVTGTAQHVGLDRVVVDVHGVGLLVHTPPAVAAGCRTGAAVELATSMVVREDSMTLYGFATPGERDTFELAQTVTGVGPRVAMAILSVLSPEQLAAAVAGDDIATLTKVPGIGKKGAERIALELRDKLPHVPGGEGAPSGVAAPTTGWQDQVTEALVGLGYSAKQSADAVAAVADEHEGGDVSRALRAALQVLAR
ncbi:Holliday junction branch migration protein RuvA [Janibacter hoylei]|uniref:Holliday junction branch migration protein RuvA n=1 Tax=Janibacter hoylei TaxID=364298 RepID=UPI0027B97361|nr:Holliday junction branch migration protein RuvA [Janibacter hoylei]